MFITTGLLYNLAEENSDIMKIKDLSSLFYNIINKKCFYNRNSKKILAWKETKRHLIFFMGHDTTHKQST